MMKLPQPPFFIGTKEDVCQACKETKKVLLLREELQICEECLKNCVAILQLADKGITLNQLILKLEQLVKSP